MSPVQLPLHGPVLRFIIDDEMWIIREQLGSASRIARTLVRNGPLRATIIGLAPGGLEGRSWPLTSGSMLALDGGVGHAARSAPEAGA